MGKMFSIIVPVFNTEQYLNNCIDSIIRSSYDNWELLLIDDGSTDRSGEICDWYSSDDCRIHVIHNNNCGVSTARNIGIDKATGDWLVFIDSDDYIEPNMLERMLEIIEDTNADLVFTDFNIIYPKNTNVFETYQWNDDIEKSFQNYLTRSWPRVAWGGVKKKLVVENGIKYPENLTIFEDFHFMCNCILHCHKIKRIQEPLYNYRVTNTSSITHTITTKRKEADERWMYDNLFRILKSMNKYSIYCPYLYWRMLYNKQALVMETSLHDKFIYFFPEKRKYILSCPSIGSKMKLMMWCLTHRLAFITRLIIIIKKGT